MEGCGEVGGRRMQEECASVGIPIMEYSNVGKLCLGSSLTHFM
jgi:hypothetical protein